MNKGQKYIAVVAAALLCAGAAKTYAAATISLNADDLVYFADNSGAFLPAGPLVEMGRFSISDAQIQALGAAMSPANYATLLSDFVPLNGTFQQFGTGSGTLFGGFDGNNATFASQSIYVMAFNAATTAASTQVGVYKGDATWTYPSDMVGGIAQIDLNAVSQPTVLIGGFLTGIDGTTNPYNTDLGNANPVISATTLAVIPEPSTITLVGLGLIGAVGMMRRRRS